MKKNPTNITLPVLSNNEKINNIQNIKNVLLQNMRHSYNTEQRRI